MKTPAVRLKARIRWPFHRRGQPAGGYHGPHGRGGTPCHIGGGVECGCRTVLLPSRGPARSRRSRSWPEARETRRRQPSRRPGTKRAGARGRTGNARAGAAGRSASTTASMSRGDRHMTETEAHRPMGKTNTARLAFVVPTRRIIPTVKRLPPYVGAVCARGTGSLCMTMMAEPHSTGNTSPRTRNWIGVHVHTRDPKDQRGLRPQDAGKLQSGRDMDGQEYSEPGEWYRMRIVPSP